MVLMLFLHCTDEVGQFVYFGSAAKLETCTSHDAHLVQSTTCYAMAERHLRIFFCRMSMGKC
jgi:hypothetical protein